MWITNWARRHTKRVIQRLVRYSVILTDDSSEIKLRFFDENSKEPDKSHEFEYIILRMSISEAAQLNQALDREIRKAALHAKGPTTRVDSDSWRSW